MYIIKGPRLSRKRRPGVGMLRLQTLIPQLDICSAIILHVMNILRKNPGMGDGFRKSHGPLYANQFIN